MASTKPRGWGGKYPLFRKCRWTKWCMVVFQEQYCNRLLSQIVRMIFASNLFTVCFLVGIWSALNITSFISFGTASLNKASPTRSSVQYHKWFIIASTTCSAICLSMSCMITLLLLDKLQVREPNCSMSNSELSARTVLRWIADVLKLNCKTHET